MENQIFDIDGMSKAVFLSPAEIKLILEIPLDEKCEAKEIDEAVRDYCCNPAGSEKKIAALKRWVEIFLINVENIKTKEDALKHYKFYPESYGIPGKAALTKIASFYGVTKENLGRLKLNLAKTLEEAIEIGFDFLAPGSEFIGPQGKVRLLRNQLPKGDKYSAEIGILDAEKNDGKIIFITYWGEDDATYRLSANWEDKIEEWSDRW